MSNLTDLFTAMQNGVTAIQTLNTTLKGFFPQVAALSTSATTGAITFNSSQPVAFLSVVTSSGGTYKVPLFS